MALQELRRRIDAIDAQILDLLSQRAQLAQEVGHAKGRSATNNYFAPERERQIFERLEEGNRGPFPNAAIRAIYREIISASRALEAAIRVAYLGPAGTFSHRAALDKFGASSELSATNTIPDVFGAVERGEADFGIVPVENSTEGVVAYTLDMFAQSRLKVCAEVYVPVVHNLATKAESLSDIKRLYAHPQAFAQSRGWLREHLRDVEVIDTTSNSKSCQLAALDLESAAITTEIAGEIYSVPILQAHIEDSPHNRTRFLVIGNNEPQPSGRDKTSIYFSVAHRAGALMKAMAAFDAQDINLTMIESRPTKQMPWEYVFFIDFQGHRKEDRVSRALKHLEEQSLFVTILGSYPEAG
jgi:chorismate mutase / prephenate dehydratase